MIKATIILWIVSVVLFFAIKVMANSMSTLERLAAARCNSYPMYIIVTTLIWLLTMLASIVMTIITIIKW